MKSILLVAVALSGCASGMKASADCSYKSGVRYANSGKDSWADSSWKNDPEGRCSFHLEAPIEQAKDAEGFARAFDRMLIAAPKSAEFDAPKMKVEAKP